MTTIIEAISPTARALLAGRCRPGRPPSRAPRRDELELIRSIQHRVARHYAVPQNKLTARARGRERIAWARAVAATLCHQRLGADLARRHLAAAFGRTTGALDYQRAAVADRLATDPAFAADFTRLRQTLNLQH